MRSTSRYSTLTIRLEISYARAFREYNKFRARKSSIEIGAELRRVLSLAWSVLSHESSAHDRSFSWSRYRILTRPAWSAPVYRVSLFNFVLNTGGGWFGLWQVAIGDEHFLMNEESGELLGYY